jgi:hypothetical protein
VCDLGARGGNFSSAKRAKWWRRVQSAIGRSE